MWLSIKNKFILKNETYFEFSLLLKSIFKRMEGAKKLVVRKFTDFPSLKKSSNFRGTNFFSSLLIKNGL